MSASSEIISNDSLPELTVSALSALLKQKIESEFAFVKIRAEIGRVSRPASGHIYLDLKDDQSVLAGVIWKGFAKDFKSKLEEGLEVIVIGRITTFSGQSRYQIIIEDLKPAGLGSLMLMLDRRKKALAMEGLFDEKFKKKLPFLPEKIGIVTSITGSVLQDILHRFRDRFPQNVIIWPITVQGANCSFEVVSAIEELNSIDRRLGIKKPDLIIVARGGGSIEDLWGFNEERVVRAVWKSSIPVISAIGHETDTTLIDYAADRRAPTPSAAAEMAVPVKEDLVDKILSLDVRIQRQIENTLESKGAKVTELALSMPQLESIVWERNQYLDLLSTKFDTAIKIFFGKKRLGYEMIGAKLFEPKILLSDIENRKREVIKIFSQINFAYQTAILNCKTKINEIDRLLDNLSYRNTLKRGYVIVRDENKNVMYSSSQASAVGSLSLEFHNGKLEAIVKKNS